MEKKYTLSTLLFFILAATIQAAASDFTLKKNEETGSWQVFQKTMLTPRPATHDCHHSFEAFGHKVDVNITQAIYAGMTLFCLGNAFNLNCKANALNTIVPVPPENETISVPHIRINAVLDLIPTLIFGHRYISGEKLSPITITPIETAAEAQEQTSANTPPTE